MNLSFTEKKKYSQKFWKVKRNTINSKSYRSSKTII